MYQWIGFVGKILTGNHGFSYEIWSFPVSMFPTKPICLAGELVGLRNSGTQKSRGKILGVLKMIPKTNQNHGFMGFMGFNAQMALKRSSLCR